MGRTKTPAGFIKDGRKRRLAFATRRRTFLEKARELATVCGVPVAVVCADLKGGAPTVRETQAGVLDRYRALPDGKRAEHTHVRHLEGLQGKEHAKLARVRQAGPVALAPPHQEMSRMTLEELRGLLVSVDTALAAAAQRRRALGLPPGDDDDAVVVPCVDSGGPWTAGGSESDAGYFHQMLQGRGDDGILDQPMFWPGLQAHDGGMIPHDEYYYHGGMNMVQPSSYNPQYQYNLCNGEVHLGGYQQQQMPSNSGYYHEQLAPAACFQPSNAIAQPWDGALQCDGSSSSSHMGTSGACINGNFNNGAVHDLAIWSPAESSGACINGNFSNGAVHDLAIWSPAESSNAIVGHPFMHASGNTPAARFSDQFTGNNFSSDQFTGNDQFIGNNFSSDQFLDMGFGGNGMNCLGGYETQGSSNNLQYYGASQNSSSVEELFRYGSDD